MNTHAISGGMILSNYHNPPPEIYKKETKMNTHTFSLFHQRELVTTKTGGFLVCPPVYYNRGETKWKQ